MSPNKTVEGFIGGLLLAAVVAAVLAVFPPWAEIGLTRALVIAGLISIFAPLGDLAESMVKRNLGVKDMESVLPGHGRMLNRIDGSCSRCLRSCPSSEVSGCCERASGRPRRDRMIGMQTLKVADNLSLDVAVVAARRPSPELASISARYPHAAVVVAGGAADERDEFARSVTAPVSYGTDAIVEVATMSGRTVVNAIVGSAGLRAPSPALEAGNRVALANKESLVAGGMW